MTVVANHLKPDVVACVFCVLLISVFAEAGSGQAQEETRLETVSDQGTFLIVVVWEPDDLGRDNVFTIAFVEPETRSVLEDMKYNFIIQDIESGDQIVRRVDQTSDKQTVRFVDVGPYNITIQDIDGLGEDATLSINVTPEFPRVLSLIVALTLGSLVGVARLNNTNLFRRNP